MRLSFIVFLSSAVLFIHPVFSAEAVTIKGEINAISMRAGMVLVKTEGGMEVVEYDDSTQMMLIGNDTDLYKDMFVAIEGKRNEFTIHAAFVKSQPPVEFNKGRLLSFDEFEDNVKDGIKVYDLRDKDIFVKGHIPGAAHISEFNRKEKEILLYCFNRSCDGSGGNNKILKDDSVSKKFFSDGLHTWTKQKKPLESTVDHMEHLRKKGVPLIILDIRDEAEIKDGYIPDAVSIPSGILELTRYRFPVYLKAHIFVYGSDEKDGRALKAAKIVAGWSYKNVFLLQGGLKEYRLRGLRIAKGEIDDEINFKRNLRDHEVPLELFKQYVQSLPDDIIVLDVRSNEEVEKGSFKTSLSIPLDELQYRLDELDREKDIITHCTSGQRALIGYHILKKAGYKVSCLNAYVGFDDLGLYTISDN